jgi:hypothetical protein
MRLQNLAKFIGCFALGALVAALYFRQDKSPLQGGSGAPVAQTNDGLLPGQEQRIAEDIVEVESNDVASGQLEPEASASRDDADIEAFQSLLTDARAQSRTKATQREIELLTNAGFTRERIEWIRTRVEELRAAREGSGPDTDPYMSGAYSLDKDLDLVGEIGEEEYDKYRHALGRPSGVRIDESPDSGLQTYGLQAGDVILRVNGTRIYNRFIFSKAARDFAQDGNTVMEVVRSGQKFSVAVPSDRLAMLRTEASGAARLRNLGPPPMSPL